MLNLFAKFFNQPLNNFNISRNVSTISRNKRKKTKGKVRGPYVKENDLIYPGQIITRQNKLLFHPGLNVNIGKNNTLNALAKGRVVISSEKLCPDFTRYKVQNYYKDWKGQPSHKKFFNVIADKLIPKYILKDAI